ncbi:aldehyde dehydrogenase family protein [Pseudomonas putida]|uniref:aldehyde dehydrogenase family protein n=1 Tax=Pseudomonas putida TaxID=303 RepID=UPI001AEA71C7|nr:aldehyde dehydrogenase family protein [Pseudomonas putida]HDS1703051.1 aldehyde dehydrogenase family protein [Pseudomonas putida]
MLPGFGHIAGAALSLHQNVDKITFTGSTAVGKQIVQASTSNLKKAPWSLAARRLRGVRRPRPRKGGARGSQDLLWQLRPGVLRRHATVRPARGV